jgi:hypothetical protein
LVHGEAGSGAHRATKIQQRAQRFMCFLSGNPVRTRRKAHPLCGCAACGEREAGANAATLAAATAIAVEDGAEITSTSAVINLPANAAITVGDGATLTAAGATNTWANLKTLTVGNDGSAVDLSGVAATLAGATSIAVGEGSELKVGSALTLAAITNAATAITGDGTISAATVAAAAVPKLIASGVRMVVLNETIYNTTFTVAAGKTRYFGANIVLGESTTIDVQGNLVFGGTVTLKNEATLSGNGALALVAGKTLTLGHASAKIAGTSYEIRPESGLTTGTVGVANVTDTTVAFAAGGIYGTSLTTQGLLSADTEPDSAAVLIFWTADSALTITENTVVDGVILDVSSKGVITVTSEKTLTLNLGAGDGNIGSGGIFTKAGGGATTLYTVKANAVQNTTALDEDTAAGLAQAPIANTGSATTVKADTPAPGVITNTTNVVIDAEDTFAVSAAAITATHI